MSVITTKTKLNSNNTDVEFLVLKHLMSRTSTYIDDLSDDLFISSTSLLKIIKNIGEPLLRNKLEDEIKSLSELEIKDDISIIADKLRDKNFEDIKQELNKYSQEKQRQILEKLFGNQND